LIQGKKPLLWGVMEMQEGGNQHLGSSSLISKKVKVAPNFQSPYFAW
jgi:hypothetical protein